MAGKGACHSSFRCVLKRSFDSHFMVLHKDASCTRGLVTLLGYTRVSTQAQDLLTDSVSSTADASAALWSAAFLAGTCMGISVSSGFHRVHPNFIGVQSRP